MTGAEVKDIRRGTELANGATVLLAKAVGPGEWVVLAEWNDEFVTWRVNDRAECYWGNYFRGCVEAARDYLARSRKGGEE